MSIQEKASAGCKKSKHGSNCSTQIQVGPDDWKEVEGFDTDEEKRDRLLQLAASGCGDGCGCAGVSAHFAGDHTIVAMAYDPNSKVPHHIDDKLK